MDSYEILDTLADKNYDNIIQLASEIFDMPISLITMIDHDRQWMKAKLGLDVDETPRDHAFCAHTIMTDEVMIVEDASVDERFKNNPLVLEDPQIRFYAGAPIIVEEDAVMGAVCIIDRKPRTITERESAILSSLAKQVSNLLEIRKTTRLLKENKEKLRLLHEIIPMCAWCKNIRDSDDFWTKVEEYVSSLADRNITHAICPDCEKDLHEDPKAKNRPNFVSKKNRTEKV